MTSLSIKVDPPRGMRDFPLPASVVTTNADDSPRPAGLGDDPGRPLVGWASPTNPRESRWAMPTLQEPNTPSRIASQFRYRNSALPSSAWRNAVQASRPGSAPPDAVAA